MEVEDYSSRTTNLSWTAPYDGNSPITVYNIIYKTYRFGILAFREAEMSKPQVKLGKWWKRASVWFSESSCPERSPPRHPRKSLHPQSDLFLQPVTYQMIITQYSIRVSAENALGEGEPSGKQTVKTLQEAPEGGFFFCQKVE